MRKDRLPAIVQHGRQFRFFYRDANGTRHRVSEPSLQAAEAKRAEILGKLAKGTLIVAPSTLTFDAWADNFLAEIKEDRAGRTYEDYVAKVAYARKAFGDRALQKITKADITKLMTDLKETVSDTTRRTIYVVLKSCLQGAVIDEKLDRNPAANVKAPKVAEHSIGDILPRQKFGEFLQGFTGHPLDNVVRAALGTAMRRNELLALRFSDINFDTAEITVSRSVERVGGKLGFKSTKTGKVRKFRIDASLLAMFRQMRDDLARKIAGIPDGADADLRLLVDKIPADALVFWNVPRSGAPDYSRPREPSDISKAFRAQADKLGYPKLRFHDLRASSESALLESGVSVHVVAARAGHSPQMLLARYAKTTRQADESAADVMADLMKG